MIAKLTLVLPFSIAVTEGKEFNIYETSIGPYGIRLYPPVKTDDPVPGSESIDMLINHEPAYLVNGLLIEFHKDEFDRSDGLDCDPPFDFIKRIVNSFLLRLRSLSSAARVRQIEFPMGNWRLEYLTDDGSELEAKTGFVRARGGLQRHLSWIALSDGLWSDLNTLPFEHEPIPWLSLLLDAQDALPNIGSATVLAATALEVCISNVLDSLAKTSEISSEMWSWINDREFWLAEPSVEEQFDILLRILSGTSLKENLELWEAFKNLKSARNSFVHEGKARIGQDLVTESDIRRLIQKANDIVVFIRSILPADIQWPEYHYDVVVEARTKLM